MERMYPEQYFQIQETQDNKMLYLGIIILGITACVAITAIALCRK